MKRTKIVCTLGPASRDVTTLFKMGKAGMDVARLNFSHGTHEDHARMVRHLNLVGKRLGRPFGILLDLQGPKIRVGDLPEKGVKLVAGEKAIFATGTDILPDDIPVTLQTLHQDVEKGERILMDDGLLEVLVERVQGRRIFTKVIQGGDLTSHKGMNLPSTKLRLSALSAKDKEDAEFGVKLGVDYIALSFVRSAQDVRDLRRLLDRKGAKGKKIRIIVKIEKQEAVDNFEEIVRVVDGVMIARGDLGIETPASKVPVVQKQLIDMCRERAIPTIVATQMLDSMIRNPRPTRAEVSDVANAVIDHADAVMLSGESAAGKYPVEAVKIMAETIVNTEESRFDDVKNVDVGESKDVPEVIGATTRVIVEALGKPSVVVATASGDTARDVSAFRPEVPIYALTFDDHVQRTLRLIWGVEPYLLAKKSTPEKMVEQGIKLLRVQRKLKRGERVVIVSGASESESASKIEIRTI
ncbi:MAG: pyruvate kinase [Patescibacteria group bacterium]|nr:pyruvate kinase [Patescibacteria group bacterium]MBU2509253.1 pyruvate kinase [Patescibacteria group bacterium]